jgi:hypothetical protein
MQLSNHPIHFTVDNCTPHSFDNLNCQVFNIFACVVSLCAEDPLNIQGTFVVEVSVIDALADGYLDIFTQLQNDTGTFRGFLLGSPGKQWTWYCPPTIILSPQQRPFNSTN